MKANRFLPSDVQRFAPAGLAVAGAGLLAALAAWVVEWQTERSVPIALAVAAVGLIAWGVMDQEHLRHWLAGRQARYGGNALTMSLAFIGIVVVATYLVHANSRQWDLTEDRIYTLAQQSLDVTAQLPAPVEAVGYYSSRYGNSRDNIKILLNAYNDASGGKFSYRFVDPESNPSESIQAGVTSDGTLVLSLGTRSEKVINPSEQTITAALIKLTSAKVPVVYFLGGHGERSLEEFGEIGLTTLKTALERQNYTVKPLGLLGRDEGVPEDADAVVIVSPVKPLDQTEVDQLSAYLNRGGALVWLQEPTFLQPDRPEVLPPDPLAEYVATQWGIHMQDNLLVDLGGTQFGSDLFSTVVIPVQGYGSYGPSPITDRLQGLSTVFPGGARSLAVVSPPPNVSIIALVQSGDEVFGETDYAAIVALYKEGDASGIDYNEGVDPIGPLTLAVSAENAVSGARLIVFGEADFVTNQAFNFQGNGDLVLNSTNWAAEQESLISIAPKQQTTRILVPPSQLTMRLMTIIVVWLPPLAVAGLGLAVWLQRRKYA